MHSYLFLNTLLFHRKSKKFMTITEIRTCLVADMVLNIFFFFDKICYFIEIQQNLLFFGTRRRNVNLPYCFYFVKMFFQLLLFHKNAIIRPKIGKIRCKLSKRAFLVDNINKCSTSLLLVFYLQKYSQYYFTKNRLNS